jgi:hypothetical protein
VVLVVVLPELFFNLEIGLLEDGLPALHLHKVARRTGRPAEPGQAVGHRPAFRFGGA